MKPGPDTAGDISIHVLCPLCHINDSKTPRWMKISVEELERQWKVLFGVLAKHRLAVPVDVKLYLPKKWTDDHKRCQKAGIPEDERVFRTKDQLALEIVAHSRQKWAALWLGRSRCRLW